MSKNSLKSASLFLLGTLCLTGIFCPAWSQEKINAGVVYEFYIDVQNQIVDNIKTIDKLPEISDAQLNISYYKGFRPLDMLSVQEAYVQKRKHVSIARSINIPKQYNISLNPKKIAAAAKIQEPKDKDLLINALDCKNKQQYEKALNIVEQALQVNPGLKDGHFLKGDILRISGKYSESVQEYLLAINLDPMYTDAYYNIAKIFESLDNKDLALDYYRYAYSTNPEDSEIKNLILGLEKQSLN